MVMTIGIRELRDTLSKQIAAVRSGQSIIVTDHGRPVAKILPAGDESTFERLVREGRITPAKRPKRLAENPIDLGAIVSDLVHEQRR